MANVNITYYDSIDIDLGEYRKLYAETTGNTDGGVSDKEVYDFAYERLNQSYDMLIGSIEWSDINNSPCVIVSDEMELKYYSTISDAVMLCVGNSKRNRIGLSNGHIEVDRVDDCGRSEYNIYLLNSKGISAMDRIKNGSGKADLSKRCYHKAINSPLF